MTNKLKMNKLTDNICSKSPTKLELLEEDNIFLKKVNPKDSPNLYKKRVK